MSEGLSSAALEAKRAAFTKANAFLRHVILCKVRNDVGGLGSPLTPSLAVDVKKVEPASLLTAHSVQAQLESTADNPEIIRLYLRIIAPTAGLAYNPIKMLDEFVELTRTELGLPPLDRSAEDGCFPINLDCNIVIPKMPAPASAQGK